MHYLGNHRNSVRTAALTMSNTLPSAVYRAISSVRRGTGRVSLTGMYTGAVDSTFEVEIQNADAGSNAQVSVPGGTRIGNGTMTALTVDGTTDAQTFTVRLVDAGTPTAFAQIALGPVQLRAKASGAAGNGISLVIDHSGLTSSATDFSTRSDLPADTIDVVGEEWDFGAVDLMADGSVPASAPRIRLGDDPQVYRQTRRFAGGRYVYSFTPGLRRGVLADTPVYDVTGSRTATLSQGMVTENYTGLTSLYDLLSALRTSALVDVIGVVANDLLPPIGMGAVDLSIWTSSYVDGITRAGTTYVQRAVVNPVIAADAPTQAIRISCIDAGRPGAEVWDVIGAASGQLPNLTTGVPYSNGPITSLTVPIQTAPQQQATGGITYRAVLEQGCMLLKKPVLGQNAVSKTLRYRYTRRENDDCDCESKPVVGGPNPSCLGVVIPGETTMGGTAQVLRVQLDRWAAAVGGQMRSTWGAVGGGPDADRVLRDSLTNARNVLNAALDACFAEPIEPWAPATALVLDDVRAPRVENGFLYRVSDADGGSTHASTEPTWPTVIGGTVTDNGVTWECLSQSPRALWLRLFRAAQDELQFLGAGAGRAGVWTATSNWMPGRETTPATPNQHWYRNQKFGVTGGSAPIWPTDGSTVTDGGALWRDMGKYWTEGAVIAAGTYLDTHGRGLFVTDAGGTTHASVEPDWYADTITDGTVTWRRVLVQASEFIESASAQPGSSVDFNTAFGDLLRELYAAANVNFKGAGNPGTDCWQDLKTAYWWVCEQGGNYKPAFTNNYYHSVIEDFDAQGNAIDVETREFGFQITACVELLTEGDYVDIEINVTGGFGLTTYQTGDSFTLSCVKASPALTAGGTDGTNTLTWRVSGSVDGPLDDLLLDLTDSASWDYSDGGVAFTLTPGAIAWRPGDAFTFAVQGGQFKWRQDGGAWVEDVQIEPVVALADGVSAQFTQGVGQSFPAGDSYAITAVAINGVDQLRSPTDGRAEWTDDGTEIGLEADAFTPTMLAIFDHTIPPDAVITLIGNDGMGNVVEETVPWSERHIAFPIPTPAAATTWTVTVDAAGSIGWLYLDEPHRQLIEGGNTELGLIQARWVLPTAAGGVGGDGYQVTHTMCTLASTQALRALVGHARQFDDGRIGVLPNELEPEGVELVEFVGDAIEVEDAMGFQPRSTARRYLSVTLNLEPAR